MNSSLTRRWTRCTFRCPTGCTRGGRWRLCEKPLTSDADEARQVADAARDSGLVVMEAFHYRYHPLAARVRELLNDGAVGTVRHVETALCFPLPRFRDIRYRLDLAGGAYMDAGCYAVHFLRLLGGATTGAEPQVTKASAKLRTPGVDRYLSAEFRFPDGATGRATASMWSARLLDVSATVVGDAGRLRVFNYVLPQAYHRLTVRSRGRTLRERVPGDASYTHQLRAFVAAVRAAGRLGTHHDAHRRRVPGGRPAAAREWMTAPAASASRRRRGTVARPANTS